MTPSRSREENLFVIRLWRDDSARGGGWRASIVHVGSGHRLASARLHEIGDFIRLRLGPDEHPNVFERPRC